MERAQFNALLRQVANDHGIHFMTPQQDMLEVANHDGDFAGACDAQPGLITTGSSGIPAWLTSYTDPTLIRVLTQPMKIEEIFGTVKKGDWTTLTTQFGIAEPVGETSSYGDFNNNGMSNANINWVFRQSYHFQTITRWGERELAIAGAAQIDFASQLNQASALVINKMHNRIGFYGVAGLLNYGVLNDPALPAPITPAANGVNPVGGTTWASKDANGIYADIAALFGKLVAQSGGLVDKNAQVKLVMSPAAMMQLTKTNMYNVNVSDLLSRNFPNLTSYSAPEYATQSGELVQLFATSLDGLPTVEVAFTEKMRAHAVKVGLSSWDQKKSGGDWGAIWKRPFLVAQMLGV